MAFQALDDALAAQVKTDVQRALAEDIGSGDLTAQLLPAACSARAQLRVREAAVIAGRPWFDACFQALDPACRIDWHVTEGAAATSGSIVVDIEGQARALLTAERPALNFLQTLSAVATATEDRRLVADVPDGFTTMSFGATGGPVPVYGIVLETGSPGATWESLGVIGVGSKSFTTFAK